MPMIGLTVSAGTLSAAKRRDVQKSLAATLLRWEGAPDTAFFRAQAWSRVDEVPEGTFTALEDDQPRFRVDVTVPEGALSDRRKEGLVKEATAIVLVHEQPEGTWGAGGAVIRFAELAAMAKAERENA